MNDFFARISKLPPKRLALQRAEAFSLFAAPSLDRLAKMSRPVIWLLSRSTDVLVRVFGGDPKASREAISEEELLERRAEARCPRCGRELDISEDLISKLGGHG